MAGKAFILAILFLASVILLQLTIPLSANSVAGPQKQTPQIQWSQTYNTGAILSKIYSMVQTSDGGYTLAGALIGWIHSNEYDSGFWLAHVDSNGQMEWWHTYIGYGAAKSLIKTDDDGYLLAGTNAGDVAAGIIVKTDSSGKLEWNQTYEGPIYSVIQTREGGYAFSGYWGGSRTFFWLVNTDASGEVQWSRTYDRQLNGTEYDFATSVIQASDGGYVMAGYSVASPSNYISGYLIKTDSFGNVQWNRTFDNMELFSVIPTIDGGYAVAGGMHPAIGDVNVWLLAKVDVAGNLEWNQTYYENYESGVIEGAKSLVQASDGGYAVAGNSGLIKTDSSGNLQWTQTLNGTAFSLVQASDGGYAVAGSSGIAGLTMNQYLVKINTTDAINMSSSQNPIEAASPSPTIPELTPVAFLALAVAVCVVAVTLKRRFKVDYIT
ncbi:MAG: hypothetical protein NWF00_08625 [Candidatus Bathyarchaeota archaeon]|nr:hypothetical protein [Candidatus Bathyarchaeota archaeon]